MYVRQTSVRSTEAQLERWRVAAAASDLKLQEWMRLVLCAAAGDAVLERHMLKARKEAQASRAESPTE